MGRAQNVHINRIWKKLIPTLMNNSEGFKASIEEVAPDEVEIARELVLEVEPEDVTKLHNLMVKL